MRWPKILSGTCLLLSKQLNTMFYTTWTQEMWMRRGIEFNPFCSLDAFLSTFTTDVRNYASTSRNPWYRAPPTVCLRNNVPPRETDDIFSLKPPVKQMESSQSAVMRRIMYIQVLTWTFSETSGTLLLTEAEGEWPPHHLSRRIGEVNYKVLINRMICSAQVK